MTIFVARYDFRAPGAPAVVYGVVLILIMLLFPGGAAGLFRRIGAYSRRVYQRAG